MSLPDQLIISVFGASGARPGDAEYAIGVETGRLLAVQGLAVATGGYGGIMEAVCRGAAEAGGTTIGVTVPSVFPGRTGANEWVQIERTAKSLVHRLEMLTEIASGFIALPGSLGTLAELALAWNLAFVAPFAEADPPPVVAVGEPWDTVVPELTARLDTDGSFIKIVETANEAVKHVSKTLQRVDPDNSHLE